jgi:hypothetical protein
VAQGSITGSVIKGPVSGATVTAFSVDGAGRRDAELGTTTTAQGGAFTVNVGDHAGPTLVCAASGTFVDEATGGIVQLGAQSLCSLVDNQELGGATTDITLTPWTSLHAALTGCYLSAARESDFAAASSRAQLRLNDFLAAGVPGFQFRSTGVLDPTAGLAPSLTPEAWHGLLIAGISESARQISIASDLDVGVRVTGATLTTDLIRDIDDGNCVFDGLAAGGVQLAQGNISLSANTLRGAPQGLAQSLKRFVDGERNASGISSASLEGLTDALSVHVSEIFGGGAEGDLDAPVVTIVESVAGPVAGRPAITVTATDASPIADVRFTAPAPLVGTGTKTCDQPNSCRLVGDLNTALFVEGPVTITAEASDEAGNTDSVSVEVIINNSIPLITVQSPSPGVVSGTTTLRATTDDVDGIAAFSVAVPGATFLPACAPQNGVTTNCDQEPDPKVIAIAWDTTLMPEGPVTVRFTATDTANNSAFADLAIDVDNLNANSNPVITVTSPSAGVVDAETVIRAQATDANGIASFTIAVPDIEFAPVCFASAGLTRNCDREPDPEIIDIIWDTTLANEGPTRITFTATDALGNVTVADVDVDVDNLDIGSISGRVDVGASLLGASVRAFQLNDDGSRGTELGRDDSVLADGLFQIENTSSYTGPLIVVASGGSFIDPASGIELNANAGQELSAVVERTNAGLDTRLNVNLWTTLATRRTIVRRGDSASMAAAITFNRGLFEKHIRRPGQPLPILTTSGTDLSDATPDSESSDTALLALTQAGLSRVAAELCVRTAADVGAITSLDLLDVLLADLDDGILDGKQNGLRLDLDPGAREQADSYILRRDLANGVFNFTKNLELPRVTQPRNAGGIDGDSLSQAGKLLDDVALNNDANLFPAEEPPLPFDKTPPGIDFLFLQPHNTSGFGDSLTGLVTIVGTASDSQSRLARFALLEPLDLIDVLGSSIADLQVQITTDRPPNVADAAAACSITLGDPPLDLPSNDKQVCLCAEAADEVDNATRELWCFTRPDPTVLFGAPSPAEGASVTGPAVVAATAVTGFDLATFVLLDGVVDEPETPANALNTVRASIPTSFVDVANKPDIVIRAEATDIAGTAVIGSLRFTRPAPALTLTRPTPATPDEVFAKCGGTAFNPCPAGRLSFPVDLSASVVSGYDVASCTFAVTQGPTTRLSGSGSSSGTACSVLRTLGEGEIPDGDYTFAVTATDLVDRATTQTDTFRKDTVVDTLVVTAPANNLHTNATSLTFSGTVTDASGIAKVEIVLTGANATTLAATVTGSTWTASLPAPITQGLTTWTVRAVDVHGNLRDTTATPRTFTADRAPPQITVPAQPAFRNEPVNGSVTTTGTVAANTLVLTPSGGSTTPTWLTGNTTTPPAGTPLTVSRWITLRDDTSGTPPTVRMSVGDSGPGATTDAALFTVRWGLGTTCPDQVAATNPAVRSGSDFNAVLTDARTPIDLAAQTGSTTLCVAFFATDEAGNTASQFAFLRWSTTIPPVFVELDSTLYARATTADDAEKFSQANLDTWFHLTDPAIANGYVVDHAVLYNPHSTTVDTQLNYGGTVAMTSNFIEDYGASNEELTLWWADTSKALLNPDQSTARDGCGRATTFNRGPAWSAISADGGILKNPLTSTVCSGGVNIRQTIAALPAKYVDSNVNSPRHLPRFSSDAASLGLVSDSRLATTLAGFGSLPRTLKVFRLNANGSLGAEITTSACTPAAATCASVSLPSRTLAVARWTVRHTAPSTSQFQMDCSVTAADFDATCPLFSDGLVRSAGGDESPASAAILDLSGRCAMRKFEGADGCATIFLTNETNESCGQNGGACYIDKALWEAQNFSARASTGSTLTQTYRVGAVTSAWTNRTVDRANTTTRTLP